MITKEKIISLIDLTSLNDNDSFNDIEEICNLANTNLGKVAAICIYSKFIKHSLSIITKPIKIATVANFPSGEMPILKALEDVRNAKEAGADEVDIVIPYNDYKDKGYSQNAIILVSESKKILGNKTLKVIIESGELLEKDLIYKASKDAILNGADFIKTSTGKTKTGATIEAAIVMLETIKECYGQHKAGFKASGGIRTYDDACLYIKHATDIMGADFISAKTFRFGVSGLLNNLLKDSNDSSAY